MGVRSTVSNVRYEIRWTKERGRYIPPFNILRIFTPPVWVCGLASMLAVAAVLVTAGRLEAGARPPEQHSLVLFPLR